MNKITPTRIAEIRSLVRRQLQARRTPEVMAWIKWVGDRLREERFDLQRWQDDGGRPPHNPERRASDARGA